MRRRSGPTARRQRPGIPRGRPACRALLFEPLAPAFEAGEHVLASVVAARDAAALMIDRELHEALQETFPASDPIVVDDVVPPSASDPDR